MSTESLPVTIPAARVCVPWPDLSLPVVRTLSGSLLTRIANTPEIRKWLGGGEATDPVDLSPHIADPRNVTLVGDAGGFLCLNQGVGRYEVHTLFEPGTPSEQVIATMRASLDYIFTATDAVTLCTKVAWANPQAEILAKRAGFAKLYDMPLSPLDENVPASYSQLRIEKWAATSERTQALGQWFHHALDRAKEAHIGRQQQHAEIAVHDHYVGAALLCVLRGQVDKGLCLYNHWASATGFALVHEIAAGLYDIEDAILTAHPEGMEVLLCR